MTKTYLKKVISVGQMVNFMGLSGGLYVFVFVQDIKKINHLSGMSGFGHGFRTSGVMP